MRSRAPKGRCCSTELPRVDSTPVPWSRFLPWESLQLRCETQHALFENSIQAQTRAMHSMFASIIDIVEARLCGVRRERSNKLGPIDEMRSVRVRKSIYQSCVAHETRRRATLTRLDSVRRSRESTSCDAHETRHRCRRAAVRDSPRESDCDASIAKLRARNRTARRKSSLVYETSLAEAANGPIFGGVH